MFDPAYVRLVLNDNFEDAKTLLLEPLLAIHYAHLVMLVDTGIVSRPDARAIRDALDAVDLDAVRRTSYDGTVEDLYFHVEQLIGARAGHDAAGRLHTARSRNDIDMTMYRMRTREWLIGHAEAVGTLRAALLAVAARYRDAVFPAHTHTQPAQPTTVAHYMLAVIEQLERDTRRLLAAFRSVNRCPLGACAITGTGFPIDRQRTSDLLGFEAPTGNTYGSIAAVDDMLEATAATSIAVVGLGRFVQDLLLWSTAEVGYLRLPDGFVQTSSIMPQKRNPVALEHARSLASKASAELQAVQQAVHNTPFGDIVDTEDDLQPLVAAGFRDAARATGLVAAAIAEATFNVDKMYGRASECGITTTELADTLVRRRGLPFSVAHRLAGAVHRRRQGAPDASLADALSEASRLVGQDVTMSEAELAEALCPKHFVDVRRTLGGPAPVATAAALEESAGRLEADRGQVADLRRHLLSAEALRRAAASAL